jgi:hypothetical protein
MSAGPAAEPRDAANESAALVDVLAAGFRDDPFMEWIFPDEASRPEALVGWFRHWVDAYGSDARTFLLGQGEAAALWVEPRPRRLGDETHAATVAHIQAHNGDRTALVLQGLAPLANHPPRPYWYLNAIAVAWGNSGRGLGARLLAPMLARADAEQLPVYLESSNSRNLTFYGRHGFEPWGEVIRMPEGGPSVQPMWRPAST